jgi:hypothetical protein
MTNGTLVVRGVDGAGVDRFAQADRYLDRVAALSPAEWGRLDAAGQQLVATDPMAAWRRARRATSTGLVPPAVEGALGVMDAIEEFVKRVAQALGLGGAVERIAPSGTDAPRDADAERMRVQFQRLDEIAAAQPGGARDAIHALSEGLLALHTRHLRSPKSFRRAYASVEPVIPAASL